MSCVAFFLSFPQNSSTTAVDISNSSLFQGIILAIIQYITTNHTRPIFDNN